MQAANFYKKMKLRITILVICYLFGNPVLSCQNQIGIIDLDSLSTSWMEELGLNGIKKIYHKKLQEAGEKQLQYLQKKYMSFSTSQHPKLTDEEVEREQQELEFDIGTLEDIELYQRKLEEDFNAIREKLKRVLLTQLNAENSNQYRIVLDEESIIFVEHNKHVVRDISVKVPRKQITSKIETLFMEKLTEVREFLDSYEILSKS